MRHSVGSKYTGRTGFNPGKGLGISKNKAKEKNQVRDHKGICCLCRSESHWQTIEIDAGSHKKKMYFGKLLDRSNVLFPTNSTHWWVSQNTKADEMKI